MRAAIVLVSLCLTMPSVLVKAQFRGYENPQTAAILSDARYLSGDGTFGASYTQEDGVEFKEESDANGDRRGSYSYVDPTGQRHTVTYTAGKNGFRPIGDHIPSVPPPVAPQPQYVPLPQYNPPEYSELQARREPVRPQASYQTQEVTADYPEAPVSYQEPNPAPAPYRPVAAQPAYHASAQYDAYNSFERAPQYNAVTTPSPRRFYPPGKLDFNRTPNGFSYTFTKN